MLVHYSTANVLCSKASLWERESGAFYCTVPLTLQPSLSTRHNTAAFSLLHTEILIYHSGKVM